MSKLLALTTLALAAVTAPSLGSAAQIDPMLCSVNVDYSINNVSRLSYVKDFVVSADAPFSDDFSSATRFRFFDAYLTVEAGDPVVTIVFDADVSVFNTVDFTANLKVKNENKGDTISGDSGFFTSVPGAAGAHKTRYTLSCQRTK